MPRSLFTSRNGGVSVTPYESLNLALHVGDDTSHVTKNREVLAAQFGYSPHSFYFMTQVHGADVAVIDEKSSPEIVPTVDALFTMTPGKVLVTLIADCIPLLLRSDRAVAAVHVGRQGLVRGAFESALEVFQSHGISPEEIQAELGPSICGQCYEVDEEMFSDVTKQIPATATKIRLQSTCLNIENGLISKLEKARVDWKSSGLCTMHDPGFFSYRRDGVTGRQAGVIVL
jgi:YfiH family protein